MKAQSLHIGASRSTKVIKTVVKRRPSSAAPPQHNAHQFNDPLLASLMEEDSDQMILGAASGLDSVKTGSSGSGGGLPLQAASSEQPPIASSELSWGVWGPGDLHRMHPGKRLRGTRLVTKTIVMSHHGTYVLVSYACLFVWTATVESVVWAVCIVHQTH